MTSPGQPIPPAHLRAQKADPIALLRPGRVPYMEAWDLQQRLVRQRRDGDISDLMLLLEHPPVYTYGKRTKPAHILFDEEERRARDIELVRVDRGGDVTYHGPGQLVGYPILKLSTLRGVASYVRALEELLIRALATYGLVAERVAGFTGVWIDGRKIAAIGVRVASGGITCHGFALNVNPDMANFDGIVPCGIRDHGVCSLHQLGITTTVEDATERVVSAAADVFGAKVTDLSPGCFAMYDDFLLMTPSRNRSDVRAALVDEPRR